MFVWETGICELYRNRKQFKLWTLFYVKHNIFKETYRQFWNKNKARFFCAGQENDEFMYAPWEFLFLEKKINFNCFFQNFQGWDRMAKHIASVYIWGETVNRPLKANKKLKETWNHKKRQSLNHLQNNNRVCGGWAFGRTHSEKHNSFGKRQIG